MEKISVSELGWSEAIKEAIRRRSERPDHAEVIFITIEPEKEPENDSENDRPM